MADDFRSARFWAKELIEQALFEGAHVVDATMGNGHDTLYLCSLVGETGKVYAFDVQKQAVENTRARLTEAGCIDRAELFLAGHETMAEHVNEPADAILFNLGWLPGGEKEVTTRTETTLRAVNAALELLKPTGLLTICVYPGHAEGSREREALLDWGSRLDPTRFDVMLRRYLNQPNDPPLLIAVRKRP